MAAGAVFHIFQDPDLRLDQYSVYVLVGAAVLAAVADYIVNAGPSRPS